MLHLIYDLLQILDQDFSLSTEGSFQESVDTHFDSALTQMSVLLDIYEAHPTDTLFTFLHRSVKVTTNALTLVSDVLLRLPNWDSDDISKFLEPKRDKAEELAKSLVSASLS